MGVASLVLSIIGFITGCIPVCGLWIAPLLALLGLIFGIVAIVTNKKRGMGIAGTIISVLAFIAIIINIFVTLVIGAAASTDVDTPSSSYSYYSTRR